MISRNNYFILKKTQLNLVFSFFIMLLIILLISISNIAFFLLYFKNFILTENESIKVGALLQTALSTFGPKLIFIAIADIFIIFVIGIMISHRIAGPIFKVMKSLDKYGEGDLSERVILRKSDLLFELASSINSYTEKLSSKISSIRDSADSIPDCEEKKKLMEQLDSFKLEREE